MARVFPEDMDRLDPNNVAGSFQTVEDYIRYMIERIEFNSANTRMSMQAEIDLLKSRLAMLEKE